MDKIKELFAREAKRLEEKKKVESKYYEFFKEARYDKENEKQIFAKIEKEKKELEKYSNISYTNEEYFKAIYEYWEHIEALYNNMDERIQPILKQYSKKNIGPKTAMKIQAEINAMFKDIVNYKYAYISNDQYYGSYKITIYIDKSYIEFNNNSIRTLEVQYYIDPQNEVINKHITNKCTEDQYINYLKSIEDVNILLEKHTKLKTLIPYDITKQQKINNYYM